MVIEIPVDKSKGGLTGREKGHRVDQRMILGGTCLKFVSGVVERTLARSITEIAAGRSCGQY